MMIINPRLLSPRNSAWAYDPFQNNHGCTREFSKLTSEFEVSKGLKSKANNHIIGWSQRQQIDTKTHKNYLKHKVFPFKENKMHESK